MNASFFSTQADVTKSNLSGFCKQKLKFWNPQCQNYPYRLKYTQRNSLFGYVSIKKLHNKLLTWFWCLIIIISHLNNFDLQSQTLPFKGCKSLNSLSVRGPMFHHPNIDLRCFFFLILTATQPHSIMLPPLLRCVVKILKSSNHASLNGQTAQSFSNLRKTFCRNYVACSCWRLQSRPKVLILGFVLLYLSFLNSLLSGQW